MTRYLLALFPLLLVAASCGVRPCSRTAYAVVESVCEEATYQAERACAVRGEAYSECPEYTTALAACSGFAHAQETACAAPSADVGARGAPQ